MLLIKINARKSRLVLFLFLNQSVNSVKRNAAVIADDPASALGVGQTRYKVRVARLAHFIGICLENTVVMRCTVFEFLFNFIA